MPEPPNDMSLVNKKNNSIKSKGMKPEERLKKFISDPGFIDTEEAYRRGYDCGINGANDWNCGYQIFATEENRKEWDRGKKDAERVKRISNL